MPIENCMAACPASRRRMVIQAGWGHEARTANNVTTVSMSTIGSMWESIQKPTTISPTLRLVPARGTTTFAGSVGDGDVPVPLAGTRASGVDEGDVLVPLAGTRASGIRGLLAGACTEARNCSMS